MALFCCRLLLKLQVCIAALQILIATGLEAELAINSEFMSLDCVDRMVLSINGKVPGPTLRAQPGELVQITVRNKMASQSVSIHFHGQYQNNTPWQDGAASFSGCPIPAQTSWTYSFHANPDPGTYQYHSHVGGTSVGGVGGVLIIEGAVSEATAAIAGEHVLHLFDWWHAPQEEILTGLMSPQFRWPGDPQSVLINGRGSFDCDSNAMYTCNITANASCSDGKGPIAPANLRPWYRPNYQPPQCESSACPDLEVFEVSTNGTYLLRLIGATSLSFLNVAVEGHNLTIVETDGHPAAPLEVSSVDVNSGQRLGVLLQANQQPGTYVIRVQIRGRSGVRFAHALLNYTDSPNVTVDPLGVQIPQPAWHDNNFTFQQQNALRGTQSLPVPPNEQVVRRFEIVSTQERLGGKNSNGKPSVDSIQAAIGVGSDRPENNCESANNTRLLRWFLGRRTFFHSTTPVLSKLYFTQGVDELTEDKSYYQVEVGKVYDIVIQNYPACNGVCETHSFHLHGMPFWVLGTFRGEFNGSAEQVAAFNLVDPPMRDSIMTPSEGVNNKPAIRAGCGYVVIRFKPIGPGAWPFHCHQLLHAAPMGSIVVFHTGPEGLPPPPSNLLVCGGMNLQTIMKRLKDNKDSSSTTTTTSTSTTTTSTSSATTTTTAPTTAPTTAAPTASTTKLPPGSVAVTKVVGTMAMEVANCTAFTGRAGVEGAVAAGIASASGVAASNLKVALSCPSRRLASEPLARRLADAMNAAYEITIPAGSTTITAASVTSAIVSEGVTGLTSKIAAAMTAANIVGVTLTVKSVPAPETRNPTTEEPVSDARRTTYLLSFCLLPYFIQGWPV
ncbi:unnamed protein product [Polarella glacialis]|uniref:Laccase n=1 Tax=Polarella glacialis TaxID=89957 RepID=A0A813KCV4_POLGL|nr:unnamed protein product [Polarella glacialis]